MCDFLTLKKLQLCVALTKRKKSPFFVKNKNYYIVRNAGCASSRYTLKLSFIFLDLAVAKSLQSTRTVTDDADDFLTTTGYTC